MAGKGSGELDDLCLRFMTLSNDWISLNQDLERCLRSGWVELARTRTQVGFAFASVAQSADERERRAVLRTTEAEDGTLHLNEDAEARKTSPKMFGALPPRSAKSARGDFVRAAELSAQLMGIERDLCTLRSDYRKKRSTEPEE